MLCLLLSSSVWPYSTSGHPSLWVASHFPLGRQHLEPNKQVLKLMFTPTSNSPEIVNNSRQNHQQRNDMLFDNVAGLLHQAEEPFVAQIRSSCQEPTFLRPQYTKVHILTRWGN